MKSRIILFACSGIFAAISFLSCTTEVQENITPDTPLIEEEYSPNGLFREITNGPEVCRFWCGYICSPCKMEGSWNSIFICKDCIDCSMMFEYNNETYAIGDPGYDELLFNLQNHDQFVTELETFVMNQHGTAEFIVEEGTLITHPDTDNYGITFEYSLGDDGSFYEVLFTKEAGGPITVFFCEYCSGGCHPSYNPSTGVKSCTPCLTQTNPPRIMMCFGQEEIW